MDWTQARVLSLSTGRVRLDIPQLRHARQACARFEAAAPKGVERVYANPLTGHVLLLFAPRADAAAWCQQHGVGAARAAKPVVAPPSLVPAVPWHHLDEQQVLERLDSQADGLAPAQAAQRLLAGANRIPLPAARGWFAVTAGQFANLPSVILFLAAGVSAMTGGVAEAAVLLLVQLINGAIGAATEMRAEHIMASLAPPGPADALVVRAGLRLTVPAEDIVCGDTVLLEAGQEVAADLRLLAADDLFIDEGMLTGESLPVLKQAQAGAAEAPLADRLNMAYRGTLVLGGHGRGVVVATGLSTEAGRIQALAEGAQHPPTPLQRELDQLGHTLVRLSLALCAGLFGVGLLRGQAWRGLLKTTATLGVAAIPEGLPAVATLALSQGMRRMRARQVMVRRLQAVEGLGAIDVICLDKTGTLTENRMAVSAIHTAGQAWDPSALAQRRRAPELARLLMLCLLCRESEEGGVSPTERALQSLAFTAGLDGERLQRRYPLLSRRARSQGRLFMRTEHARPGYAGRLATMKGSPAEVLDHCTAILHGVHPQPLTAEQRTAILATNEQLAAAQLRVLGFAYAEKDAHGKGAWVWVGLVGMADPLRPAMHETIAHMHAMGLRTLMLTGDQAVTAGAIGRALDLGPVPGRVRVAEAAALEEDEKGEALMLRADVFARISPAHKLRIVQALQAHGHLVAMAGDGINDGPALRAAEVGIAMAGGTEGAASAADVVLARDHLESLLGAIADGRGVGAAIGRASHFLVASNLSEIFTVFGGVLAGTPSMLSPAQLLWLNLLTDMLPALALAADRAVPDGQEAPRGDSLLNAPWQLRQYGKEAAILAGGAWLSYGIGRWRQRGTAGAGALSFHALVAGQLLHALLCRGPAPRRRGPSRIGLAVAASLGVHVLGMLLPPVRRALGTGLPDLLDVGTIALGALGPLLLNRGRTQSAPASGTTLPVPARLSYPERGAAALH